MRRAGALRAGAQFRRRGVLWNRELRSTEQLFYGGALVAAVTLSRYLRRT